MAKFKNISANPRIENAGKEIYFEVGTTRSLEETDYVLGLEAFGQIVRVEGKSTDEIESQPVTPAK